MQRLQDQACRPKGETLFISADNPDNLVIRTMLYDVFGKVPYPSAQYKFQYSHLFVSKSKDIGWLKGSKMLDGPAVVNVHSTLVS